MVQAARRGPSRVHSREGEWTRGEEERKPGGLDVLKSALALLACLMRSKARVPIPVQLCSTSPPTTMAPPTAISAPCLAHSALEQVQRARSRGTGPAGRALAHPLSTQLEKGAKTLQLPGDRKDCLLFSCRHYLHEGSENRLF